MNINKFNIDTGKLKEKTFSVAKINGNKTFINFRNRKRIN